MKVIIPMAGSGRRFLEAGYKELKPLIVVDGKPMIQWVLNLFPSENDVLFICRKDHLESGLAEQLKGISPGARLKGVTPHLQGPVMSLQLAIDEIPDSEECLVFYCDFFMLWDYEDFKKNLDGADGVIPCYTGFHPHLMHSQNVYASCRMNERKEVLEVREKHFFGDDKMSCSHSPGVYYFREGRILKHYVKELLTKNQSIHGEFYVSMLYQLMIEDGLKIMGYDKISHFCQWGTPRDLEDYLYWTTRLRRTI